MAKDTEVDIEKLHANSVIGKVKIAELQVDKSYQREPNQAMVERIATEWDEISSELLLVSDRGTRSEHSKVKGGKFIVNGQHRSLGALKNGETEVNARIIDLRGHPDPASVEATFRLRTNVRMGDKPLERFKAQLRAGNPESLAIVKLLDQFGTEVNEVPVQETGINAIASIEKLYRINEGALLTETLTLMRDIYGAIGGKPTSAATLGAYSWFIVKHADESDRNRVVEVMKSAGLAALDRRGRTIASTMGGTLWLNYYRAIVDFYNERLQGRNRLDWKHGGASQWKGTVGRWGGGGAGTR